MKVLIVGGGIGGLVTALELEKVGIESHVFEAVREVRPLGVGLNLPPHATKNLMRLGLGDALIGAGLQTQDLLYFNKHGQKLWQELRGLDAGYRVPQFSIHRGELQMILMRVARERLEERIHTGHQFKSFRQTGEGRIVAEFVRRETNEVLSEAIGDLLVGADGIHSTVRRHLFPDEGLPKWTGTLLWRAAIETDPFLTGRSMVVVGHPKQKFVAYPMSARHAANGRSLVNWIAELRFDPSRDFPREDWNKRGDKRDFLPQFEAWKFDWLDVPRIIDETTDVYEFPCVDRDPLERWTFGRATLLGDAAHPMYPMGSNGASQAILDARALAQALLAKTDIDEALASYESLRRPRTSKIVLSNRQAGPELLMTLAEERAPDGFDDVEEVISYAERLRIVDEYKMLTESDVESVNRDLDAA
jgi:5-methylphenazine-1-carboxylate 1-monooxygenase